MIPNGANLVPVMVIVIVLFGAGTVVTALAECAWILWDKKERVWIVEATLHESITWEPRNALASKGECELAKKREWLAMADSFNDVSKYPEVAKIEKTQNEGVFRSLKHGGHIEDTLVCLPDTINPRS